MTHHHFLLGITIIYCWDLPSLSVETYHHFLLELTITFCWDLLSLSAGIYHQFLLGFTINFCCDLPSLSAGIYHQFLLGFTINFCWDLPSLSVGTSTGSSVSSEATATHSLMVFLENKSRIIQFTLSKRFLDTPRPPGHVDAILGPLAS